MPEREQEATSIEGDWSSIPHQQDIWGLQEGGCCGFRLGQNGPKFGIRTGVSGALMTFTLVLTRSPLEQVLGRFSLFALLRGAPRNQKTAQDLRHISRPKSVGRRRIPRARTT